MKHHIFACILLCGLSNAWAAACSGSQISSACGTIANKSQCSGYTTSNGKKYQCQWTAVGFGQGICSKDSSECM